MRTVGLSLFVFLKGKEMASTSSVVYATNTVTSNGTDVTANDTCTIGGKAYTFKAAPTTVDGEVKVGGTAALTLQNLFNAVNLVGVAGTDYGSLTVINPYAKATAVSATVLTLTVKTPGAVGNLVTLAKSAATLSVGAATFANGAGDIDTFVTGLINVNQVSSELLTELHKLTIAAD